MKINPGNNIANIVMQPIPLIIAAPDSPMDWKAQAVAIGDGLNDQRIVNPIIATGKAVLLAPGHYGLSDYLLPGTGSQFHGQGPTSLVNLNGFGILPSDVSNIIMGNFDLTGVAKDFALGIFANQVDINNILIHDINCRVLGCNNFLIYAGQTARYLGPLLYGVLPIHQMALVSC